MTNTRLLACAALLCAAGCSSPPETAASDLPLLPTGPHLGIMTAYELLPGETQAAVDAAWEEARERGMGAARVQIGWGDIEPAPGEYVLEEFSTRLADYKAQGLHTFVLIETVDSEGLGSLPPDLTDAADEMQLADGMTWDSPKIIRRFGRMLDAVVPTLLENNVFLLSVGNEPGAWLEENPGDAEALAAFVGAARRRVHHIAPQLAVTLTLEGTPHAPHVRPIVDVSDVACFNYYPLAPDLFLRDPLTVEEDIAEFLAAARGKQLVFQELGCPAGFQPHSRSGASPEKQRRFFEEAFAELRANHRFRAAFVFQMVDWSQELTDMFYIQPFEQTDLPRAYIERFEEWLRTVGLMTFESGAPRPALEAFYEGMDAVYADASAAVK